MINVNKKLLEQMVAEGFVFEIKHPTLDLYIYNYSRKCTYEKMWNEVTLLCRGLVLDGNKNIVSLPLGKFFNYEEFGPERIEKELRGHKYRVYNKADGSCGILVEYQGNYLIVTRGSFASEQSVWATNLLNSKYAAALKKLNTDKYTYVFEIVYPKNRIVVNYGDFADIIFLARINKETGEDEILEDNIVDLMKPFIVVDRYPEYENMSFEELQKLNIPNKEGFVLHGNGMRIKVKFADYCRLHSIITNITARDIWRTISTGADLTEMLENVPDEFDSWVRAKVKYFNESFESEMTACKCALGAVITELDMGFTKKDFALKNFEVNKDKFIQGMVFSLYENKDISNAIWSKLYPAHEKPFRDSEEECE